MRVYVGNRETFQHVFCVCGDVLCLTNARSWLGMGMEPNGVLAFVKEGASGNMFCLSFRKGDLSMTASFNEITTPKISF